MFNEQSIHPDYVYGEPIPRVKPRIDVERIKVVRVALRWSRILLVCAVILSLWFTVYGGSMVVKLSAAGVLLVGWVCIQMFGLGRLSLRRHVEDKDDESGSDRNARGKNRAFDQGWRLPFGMNLEIQLHIIVCMFLIQILVQSGNGMYMLVVMLSMGGVIVGLYAMAFSLYVREAGQISCRKCSYELIGLTVPCYCPECGVMIASERHMTDSPRVRCRWLTAVGLGIFVLSGTLGLVSMSQRGIVYRAMPEVVLMEMMVHDDRAFDELVSRTGARTGAKEKHAQIVDLILDRADQTGWDWELYSQGRWVSDLFLAGQLNEVQIDRLMMIDDEVLWIDGAAHGAVGEELVFSLGPTKGMDLPGRKMDPLVFVRGFDVVSLHDQGERFVPVDSDSVHFQKLSIDDTQGEAGPAATVKFEVGGEYLIRARLLLAVFDGYVEAKNLAPNWEVLSDAEMFDGLNDPNIKDIAFDGVEPVWGRLVDIEHRVVIKR